MNAEKFLNQYRMILFLIENKLAEIEQWRLLTKKITSSMSENGVRVQSNSSQQPMAKAIESCIDAENSILNDVINLRKESRKITKILEQLPPEQYNVLHKIYIQNKDISFLCFEYDRSKAWVNDIRRKALINLQNILKEDENG